MRSFICAFIATIGLIQTAQATVTLQFASGTAKLTNLANASNVVTNGMIWGVVIDTAGDGFDSITGPGYYDGFTVPAAGSSASMIVNGLASDDLFFRDDNVSLTQNIGGTDGGDGGITTVDNVPFHSGRNFAIIWMPTNGANGSAYGFLTNGGLTMPTIDGSPQSYASLFSGADPSRPANLTFGSGAGPVPEPSRMMLLGFGLVGLITRRRRK